MLIKQKILSLCRNFRYWDVWQNLLILFSTKVNLIYLLHLMGLWCCLMRLVRQSFVEIFSKISNHDGSGIFLHIFSSRTKLNCIIFLELSSCIGRVLANFDYSEVSSFLCVPVLVLKNCEPELVYILAEFFNLCLNES